MKNMHTLPLSKNMPTLQPILICLKAKEREEWEEDRRRSILRFSL
jgi:hypothetical protein